MTAISTDTGMLRAAVFDELSLEATVSAEKAVVIWKGRASQRHPERELTPFFDELLAEAEASNAKRLEMHFQQLEHFNSAAILFVMELMQRTKKDGFALTMRYAGALKWQQMTFEALGRLGHMEHVELIAV